MILLLDPAHGGHDCPGIVAPRGLTEAEATLALALEVRDLLIGRPGLEVRLTRSEDAQVSSAARVLAAKEADWTIVLQYGGASQEAPVEIWVPKRPRARGEFASILATSLGQALSCAVYVRNHLAPSAGGADGRKVETKSRVLRDVDTSLAIFAGRIHTYEGEDAAHDPTVRGRTATAISRAVGAFLRV